MLVPAAALLLAASPATGCWASGLLKLNITTFRDTSKYLLCKGEGTPAWYSGMLTVISTLLENCMYVDAAGRIYPGRCVALQVFRD